MKELIRQYEHDIETIRGRIAQLKEDSRRRMDTDELNELRSRTELLETEMYEMMYSAALMRRITAPKPPSPSYAARQTAAAGDAAW